MKLNITANDTKNYGTLNFVNIFKNIFMCYAITLVCLLIFAFIITYTDFPQSFVPFVVIMITIFSVIFAGILTAKGALSKGWLGGSIAGMIYMVTLYCIASLAFQTFAFGMNVVAMLALGLFAGAFGGIVGINTKTKKYR